MNPPQTLKKPDLVESRIRYLRSELRTEEARHARRVDRLRREIGALELRRLEGGA